MESLKRFGKVEAKNKAWIKAPVQFVLVITGGPGLAVSVLVLNTGDETPSLFWVKPVTQNSYWVAGRR